MPRSFNPTMARAPREAARVSQVEITDVLGVMPSTICRWESGERRPRAELAERYADDLNRLSGEVRREG